MGNIWSGCRLRIRRSTAQSAATPLPGQPRLQATVHTWKLPEEGFKSCIHLPQCLFPSPSYEGVFSRNTKENDLRLDTELRSHTTAFLMPDAQPAPSTRRRCLPPDTVFFPAQAQRSSGGAAGPTALVTLANVILCTAGPPPCSSRETGRDISDPPHGPCQVSSAGRSKSWPEVDAPARGGRSPTSRACPGSGHTARLRSHLPRCPQRSENPRTRSRPHGWPSRKLASGLFAPLHPAGASSKSGRPTKACSGGPGPR